MGKIKPHQRQPILEIPSEAPVRPTSANKMATLQRLIDQYVQIRKAVNGFSSESAILRAEVEATRAYRQVAAYFADHCGTDKSCYAHMNPPPKDFMALCTLLGIEFKSFIKTKRDGALVHTETQENNIGKIKRWVVAHPHAPKASGQQFKR